MKCKKCGNNIIVQEQITVEESLFKGKDNLCINIDCDRCGQSRFIFIKVNDLIVDYTVVNSP